MKDYYWVGANNSINLSDSRLFGLVPKDHVIGKAAVIWFSKRHGYGIVQRVSLGQDMEKNKVITKSAK